VLTLNDNDGSSVMYDGDCVLIPSVLKNNNNNRLILIINYATSKVTYYIILYAVQIASKAVSQ